MGLIPRRKRRSDSGGAADGVVADGGDVRIIGPAAKRPLDETGELADDFLADSTPGGDLVRELSDAFDDEAEETGAGSTSRVPVFEPRRGAPDTQSTERVAAEPAAEPDRPSSKSSTVTTISIGGDDELPDAVYLDDEMSGAPDGTVFIDDDGQGDAILPHDATGPGIEPRLRQRRIGVRRAEGRRRLKWFAIIAVVFIVLVAAFATLGSGLFSVENVTISGQQYADDEAVQAVVDDLKGTPTLLVDTDAAEDELEEIAWVDEARVRTDFPNSVSIELRERVPLATVRGADDQYRILDREGRVLAVESGRPIAPVLISGPETLELGVGQFADVGYAAAATLVTKLSPEVRSRLISISAAPDGSDIRLLLRNELINGDPAPDIEVRLGAAVGDNEQNERLVRLERVLDDVEGASTTIIDVSTEESTER